MPFPYMAAAVMGAAGLDVLGGHRANVSNAKMAREANTASQANAREQMAFQERMSSTAYQRAMTDMRLAGLNPILAYSQGGASSPSGSTSQAQASRNENIYKGAANSAKDAVLMKAQLANIDAQTANQIAQANLSNTSARKTALETVGMKFGLADKEMRSHLPKLVNQTINTALTARYVPYISDAEMKKQHPDMKKFGPFRIYKKDGK